jgi:Na+/pantothenate symporter
MRIVSLILTLAAVYVPAVLGARGRGSRRMGIGLILVGFLIGSASMMLGHHLVGTFDPVLFPRFEGMPLARQMAVDLFSLIVRVWISFCFGSFLAALLYAKRPATSPNLLGLGVKKSGL